jgi:RecA/RadA recombinase
MSNAEKLKALKLTIDKIDKDYGKGSVMMMNEKSQEPMEVISTGSIGLDVALGVGGLPKGRIIEIYGPESSGKTTIAIHVIAEAQKKGGMCAIIDAEHAFDSSYAKNTFRRKSITSQILPVEPGGINACCKHCALCIALLSSFDPNSQRPCTCSRGYVRHPYGF